MHFTEDLPAGNYIINAYTAKTVTINQRCHEKSLYVAADVLMENIPLHSSDQLTKQNIQFIIDLEPQLLIVGSGDRLQFPDPQVMAYFSRCQIGFEVMEHTAACRTFAVLSAEQRRVGALLLMCP